jgi:putative transposase
MSRGSCGAFGYLISPASALPACYCPFILSESRGKPVDPGFIVRETSSLHERYDVKYRNALPNHFHLVLWPRHDGDLSRWMQWSLTTHVRRYHRHYGGSGHVWQGRFRAFPIQDDGHLPAVLRYVESNPVRAELVSHAADWRWSSAPHWARRECLLIPAAGPVERGPRWLTRVNRPLSAGDLSRIRSSVTRGAPLGTEDWSQATAVRMGLQASLRPRGRPRKKM